MLMLVKMQKNQFKHVNKFSLMSCVVWLFPAVVRRLVQKGTIRAVLKVRAAHYREDISEGNYGRAYMQECQSKDALARKDDLAGQ